MAATISCTSASLPFPVSLHAKWPTTGSTNLYPSSLASLIFLCVTSFSYIWTFIAGQINFFVWQARKVVETISSAIPWTTLAIILAVAGTNTMISAHLAKVMWAIGSSLVSSNKETSHLCLLNDSKLIGLTNSCACSVMTTLIS